MPRKNKTPKHVPFTFVDREASKHRFASRKEAEKAAELRMLQNPSVELFAYRSDSNDGWYLTRKKPRTSQV